MPTIYSDKATLSNLPERRPFDFYSTDLAVCKRALWHLPKLFPAHSFSTIIDAGAGTGVWGMAARERYPKADIVGIEIREEAAPPVKELYSLGSGSIKAGNNTYSIKDVKLGTMIFNRWFSGKSYLHSAGYNENINKKEASAKDYAGFMPPNKADLVIGNPPFSIAEDFVIYSIENALNDTGVICMLLQASFLWGERRFKRVHSKYNPKEVVIRKRVSFTGDGKTNGDDYAYYFWEKGYTGRTQVSWDVIVDDEEQT